MTGGPPISSRELLYSPSIIDYGLSIIVGCICLFIAFITHKQNRNRWTTRCLFVVGILTCVTAPWIGSLHKAVIGAYPTIDKEGSLLFFEHGVHHLWLTNTAMPPEKTGLPLIGIHIGHLIPTEILSWFVPTFVAFNIQAILHLFSNTLGFLFLIDGFPIIKAKEWEKWIVALLIGAQLHVFRDIHWYTIEKSALFPIFIFWGVLRRQQQLSFFWLPAIYLLAGLYNFYWAILCPMLVLTELPSYLSNPQTRTVLMKPLLGCIVVGLFLGICQMNLQTEQYLFAAPEAFTKRATLDVFSVVQLDWNRMGFWQPLNPLVLILGGWGLLSIASRSKDTISDDEHTKDHQHRDIQFGLMLCFGLSLMLSLGPFIADTVPNPIYRLFSLLPGMWRFAKPEIFMLLAYSILGIGMLYKQWPRWVWWVTIILYLCGLYTSPAFPYLTKFVEGTLQY